MNKMAENSKETLSDADLATWQKSAKDGDEENQLKLGQHYLTLADSGSEESRLENGRKGISWLVDASRQGNEEATKILQKCLKTGTGIDENNKEDVEWCVETSSTEKKIRSAARNLFRNLNKTHQDVMSGSEYVAAVKKISGGDVLEQKVLLAAGKKIGDQINETEFVKVLSKKIQGQITLTSEETTDRSSEYKKAGIVQKVVRYPRETAMAMFDYTLENVSKEGMNWVTSLIPTNQLYLLSIFFLYSFISARLLFQVIPLTLFYISLAIMIVTTLQMFYKKRKLKEATALANVLKTYNLGVDVDDTKSQYTWNSLTPYFVYFGALPLLVISFSLANKLYIPCSELCVFSAVISFICFSALSDSHDLITLLALVCNFLSALPTFFHDFPHIPVVTSLLHLLTGSIFTLDCGSGFKINFGIPSVAYLIVPIFFIFMAAKKSWRGVYQILVPHLVCYFWFNLMTSFFPFTTWKGLARATIGYFFLPFLVTVGLFVIFLGILYVFVKLFQTELFGKLIITLLLGSIPLLLTQTKILFGKNLDKKYKSVKKIVMIMFAVLAIIPIIFIKLPSFKEPSKFELPLDKYLEICGNGDGNPVPSQIKCSHLINQKVTWTGTFKTAKVTKIENGVDPLLAAFPSFIANQLRCVYGVEFGDCDDPEAEIDPNLCHIMKSLGRDCHLKNHDTFRFIIVVEVEGLGQVILDAGDSYKHTVTALEPQDTVEFTGVLDDGVGTSSISMKLKHISCTSRELNVMMQLEEESVDEMITRELNSAITVAFHFFWYPLVEYSP